MMESICVIDSPEFNFQFGKSKLFKNSVRTRLEDMILRNTKNNTCKRASKNVLYAS